MEIPSTRMEAPSGSERRVGEAEAAAGRGAASPPARRKGPPPSPARRFRLGRGATKRTARGPPERWGEKVHGGFAVPAAREAGKGHCAQP